MNIARLRTARSARLSFLACTLFAAAAVAGCTAASPSGAALTKEELIAQGNAICAAGNEKMDAAMPDWSQGEPAAPTAEAFYNTVTTEVATMIEGLRGLTPPADLEADYTAMLTAADADLVKIKADGLDAFLAQEEDPFADANEIANKIGLTVCGQSN